VVETTVSQGEVVATRIIISSSGNAYLPRSDPSENRRRGPGVGSGDAGAANVLGNRDLEAV